MQLFHRRPSPTFCLLLLTALTPLFSSTCTYAQDDSGFKYLEVKVIGPDGKPLADVAVDVKIDMMEFPMPTDEDGKISLNAPSSAKSQLQLSVKHDEYVAVSASWRGGDSFPEEFSIALEKGEPIGGLVLDEQGEPIEGVKIEGVVARMAGSAETEGKLQPLLQGHLATTDEKGRWQIMTKTETPRQLFLKPSHDDYINNNSNGSPVNWEQLKKLEHKLVLKKGIELKGRVTNPEGEAIVGAKVALGEGWRGERLAAETDEKGEYRLMNVSVGSTILTIVAEGWSPDLQTVVVRRDMPSVDFQLEPGQSIRVRVTDPDGEPIAGVGLAAVTWRGHRSMEDIMPRGKTDSEGIWTSESLPTDEIEYDFFKQGHMSSRNNKLAASEELHTIVMRWPLVVSGKVVDAESGLPLEKFDIVRGVDFGNNSPSANWQRHDVKQGTNGKYRREFNEPYPGYLVRIEAEGYRPGISRMIRSDEGEVTINFELEEGTGPSGVVKTPDDKPAVGAKLMVATGEEGLYFNNGVEQMNRRKPHTTTDEQGKYALPFLDVKYALVCLHDTGWARLSGIQVEKAAEIQLQAWATVEGTVFAGKGPLSGEQISLYYQQNYTRDQPQVNWHYSTQSNRKGEFKFDRLIGSEAVVARMAKIGDTGQGAMMSAHSHSEQVILQPGKTTKVQIGGTGRSIQGQLKMPKDSDQNVLWSMGLVKIYEQNQRVNAGGFFNAIGRAIAGQVNQPRAPQKPTFRRHYATAIDAEGGFSITDVLPGQYQLNVQLYTPPEDANDPWGAFGRPIGTLNQQITVSEAKDEKDSGPLDLGEFTLKMTKPSPPNRATGVFQLIAPPVPAPAEK